MILTSDAPQRSDEWRKLRAGRLTASVVSAIYATGRGGKESAARRDLRVHLARERVRGGPLDDTAFVDSVDIQRGLADEPKARSAYEMATGRVVTEVGFVYWSDLAVGCSPDGYVGDGLIQIKCPRPHKHYDVIEMGVEGIEDRYLHQMRHECWVTGRPWCHFVSFCEGEPDHLVVASVEFSPTEAELKSHELLVRQFLREVDEQEARIRALKGRTA